MVNDTRQRSDLVGVQGQSSTGSELPGRYDTSAYMIGSVAVGVILPESTGNSENWTSTEQTQVSSEIQTGLARWAAWSTSSGDFANKDQATANVSFTYDFHYSVPTTYEPISLSSDQQCLWINQVMANMGYTNPACGENVYDYLNALRNAKGTDWATVIFVVDSSADYDGTFSDGYFAYSYINGPLMVMTYDNDGWGISYMNQVVQHEMGHIFGAGDNYYQAGYGGCTSTTQQYGDLGIPNSNCEYNNPGADADVLMNDNNPNRNHWTAQYQVGWRDSNGNGIPDVVDTLPKFSMDLLSPDLTVNGVVFDDPYPASAWYVNAVTLNTIVSARFHVDFGAWSALCLGRRF